MLSDFLAPDLTVTDNVPSITLAQAVEADPLLGREIEPFLVVPGHQPVDLVDPVALVSVSPEAGDFGF